VTFTHTLRTPNERFVGLPDLPFEGHYVDTLPGYEGLRAHYLDLGPPDAERTFLWCTASRLGATSIGR
jgi:haloalkane dehalogenase